MRPSKVKHQDTFRSAARGFRGRRQKRLEWSVALCIGTSAIILYAHTQWNPEALPKSRELSKQLSALESQNQRLKMQRSKIKRHIQGLKADEHIIESAIRSRLGYIREGDVIFDKTTSP